MAAITIRPRFDKSRMRIFANRSNNLSDFVAHFAKVHAVHDFPGNVITLRAIDDLLERSGTLHGSAHGKQVIFANEDDRQFVERSKIQRFVECTLIDCAVAEKTKGHAIFVSIFAGKRETAGERHVRSDNGVPAIHISFCDRRSAWNRRGRASNRFPCRKVPPCRRRLTFRARARERDRGKQ